MVKKYNSEELVKKVINYIKENNIERLNTYLIAAILDCSVAYARVIWYKLLWLNIINKEGVVNYESIRGSQ